jgi:hypothetical protein
MSAHKKGKAHTLQFDPYQIDQNQHLRTGTTTSGGATYAQRLARRTRNTFKPVKQFFESSEVKKVLAPIGKALAPLGKESMKVLDSVSHELMNVGRKGIRKVGELAPDMISRAGDMAINKGVSMALGMGAPKRRGRPPKAVEGGATYAQRLARRTRNTFKPVKQFFESNEVKKALAPVGKALAPLGKESMKVLDSVSHELMNVGRKGIRKVGELAPDLISRAGDMAINKGVSMALGMGAPKRRGRPPKGSGKHTGGALYPAGYGVPEDNYWC